MAVLLLSSVSGGSGIQNCFIPELLLLWLN